MGKDQLSLSGLEDIVLPSPPPFWPPASGVWILLVILLVGAAAAICYWYTRRKENSYRRAGLVLLAAADSLYEVDIVLKRVSLAAFPRETVASLYGQQWTEFLDGTCSHCNFGSLTGSEGQVPLNDIGQTPLPGSDTTRRRTHVDLFCSIVIAASACPACLAEMASHI